MTKAKRNKNGEMSRVVYEKEKKMANEMLYYSLCNLSNSPRLEKFSTSRDFH